MTGTKTGQDQEIIVAIFFVALFGVGAFAGFLTLTFATIGFIGKLLYEAIEETDIRQVKAITATGASQGQILTYGIVPQVLLSFYGISVFR